MLKAWENCTGIWSSNLAFDCHLKTINLIYIAEIIFGRKKVDWASWFITVCQEYLFETNSISSFERIENSRYYSFHKYKDWDWECFPTFKDENKTLDVTWIRSIYFTLHSFRLTSRVIWYKWMRKIYLDGQDKRSNKSNFRVAKTLKKSKIIQIRICYLKPVNGKL